MSEKVLFPNMAVWISQIAIPTTLGMDDQATAARTSGKGAGSSDPPACGVKEPRAEVYPNKSNKDGTNSSSAKDNAQRILIAKRKVLSKL
jgi:hypothetical protein